MIIGLLRIRGAPHQVQISFENRMDGRGRLTSTDEMLHAAVGAPNELTLTYDNSESRIEIFRWNGSTEAEFILRHRDDSEGERTFEGEVVTNGK